MNDSKVESPPRGREQVDWLVQVISELDCDISAGYDLLNAVNEHFGFAGVVMGPEDAKKAWEELDEEEGEELPFDFEAIRMTWWWRKGFTSDPIMEDMWEMVKDSAREARKGARSRG